MSQELIKLGEQRAKELGLIKAAYEKFEMYHAIHIHTLLGAGQEMNVWSDARSLIANSMSVSHAESTALLIGIRPIHKETREEKLEALVREFIEVQKNAELASYIHTVERAKQLLSERDI